MTDPVRDGEAADEGDDHRKDDAADVDTDAESVDAESAGDVSDDDEGGVDE